ncbi:MAG: hypothetical protein QNJ19_10935 [Woeseiaceae bacterium]|nr:hypothetical protein [Woeseiaceae bacterium]
MPAIIPLGWFHTVIGIVALISGVITLFKYKEISYRNRSGVIYLVTTLVTAVTALMIYQHGGFGVAHAMGVAALLALAVGMLAEARKLFGKWSRHIQAFSFSATLLFHCLPAVTDGLLRLPVGDPILTSINDPIMQASHLALFVAFLIGVTIQLRWISRQPAAT